MTDVRVPMADAVGRRLPLVSVRSGRVADGYLAVPIGLGFWARLGWAVSRRSADRPMAQLPLTQREFNRVIRLRTLEQRGVLSIPLFIALGVVFSRFPVLLPLGVVIALVSAVTVVTAHLTLGRFVPVVVSVGQRSAVRIEDVHDTFAQAVEAGNRRN